MSTGDAHTWDDGRLTEDDVIEAADGTGYTSVSSYTAGEDGHEPDYDDEYDTAYDDGDTHEDHDDHDSYDSYDDDHDDV
ncbi:hypothetical protein [Streptomyces sp. NPDC096339]|uniref:hypothetical protein n=1 Tax=Streptomyces sp. NPDC096339 TaxID=3366086 RepID=UPI00380D8D77